MLVDLQNMSVDTGAEAALCLESLEETQDDRSTETMKAGAAKILYGTDYHPSLKRM